MQHVKRAPTTVLTWYHGRVYRWTEVGNKGRGLSESLAKAITNTLAFNSSMGVIPSIWLSSFLMSSNPGSFLNFAQVSETVPIAKLQFTARCPGMWLANIPTVNKDDVDQLLVSTET